MSKMIPYDPKLTRTGWPVYAQLVSEKYVQVRLLVKHPDSEGCYAVVSETEPRQYFVLNGKYLWHQALQLYWYLMRSEDGIYAHTDIYTSHQELQKAYEEVYQEKGWEIEALQTYPINHEREPFC